MGMNTHITKNELLQKFGSRDAVLFLPPRKIVEYWHEKIVPIIDKCRENLKTKGVDLGFDDCQRLLNSFIISKLVDEVEWYKKDANNGYTNLKLLIFSEDWNRLHKAYSITLSHSAGSILILTRYKKYIEEKSGLIDDFINWLYTKKWIGDEK